MDLAIQWYFLSSTVPTGCTEFEDKWVNMQKGECRKQHSQTTILQIKFDFYFLLTLKIFQYSILSFIPSLIMYRTQTAHTHCRTPWLQVEVDSMVLIGPNK